jgi:hypothetical protein
MEDKGTKVSSTKLDMWVEFNISSIYGKLEKKLNKQEPM